MKIVKALSFLALIVVLTLISQIGGIVVLACLPLFSAVNARIKNPFLRPLLKTTAFMLVYTILSFTFIPFLAKKFGSVPLPISKESKLQPLNFMTCILNRHYVRPQLQEALMYIAEQMQSHHKGTVVCYLDAGFPFVNGFPLIPHLSHKDGKKADVAFLYVDAFSGKDINGDAPSFIGYGVCEQARPDEIDMPSVCEKKGYWQYSLLKKIVLQQEGMKMKFDIKRTKALIKLIAAHSAIRKIFIEPHLKQRMNLQKIAKIRFHGCQAVRHDDHIHVELK